jgi:hypothetical protein
MWRWSPNRGLWCALALTLLSGCVTVYQPLVGLQRPVAIEPRANNFKGLRLELNCSRGDYLWQDEAELLCARAGKLFESQGATVRTRTDGVAPTEEEIGNQQAAPGKADDTVDLRVDLSSRVLHEEKSIILWVLSFASATIIPGISEYTFAQDITVRDAEGFLFAQDHWQARFVRYMGVLVWSFNFLLDHTLRESEEMLTGDAMSRDFSRDFYRQLNQVVFNAKTRWALLREPPPVVALPPKGN